METTTIDAHAAAFELHRERYGAILAPTVWNLLAAEYLHQPQTAVARAQASLLGNHVHDQVRIRWGRDYLPDSEVYDHHGVTWSKYDGQPYEGLAGLSTAIGYGRAFVSTEHCDHPVWTQDTNLRFRIWHDSAHVEHGLGFGVDDELRLFGVQATELHPARWRVGEEQALFCESVYQLAAYVSLGRYPDVQRVVEVGPVGRIVLDLLVHLQSVDPL